MNVFPHWLRRFQKREVGEAAPGRCCPRQTSRDHRWRACPDGHGNAPGEAPRNLTHPQVDWACLVGQRFFGIDYCFRFIHNGFQWKSSCTHHSMAEGERGSGDSNLAPEVGGLQLEPVHPVLAQRPAPLEEQQPAAHVVAEVLQ